MNESKDGSGGGCSVSSYDYVECLSYVSHSVINPIYCLLNYYISKSSNHYSASCVSHYVSNMFLLYN